MTPIERQLKNLHDIRLPENARTRMREELLSYAELHAAPILSPISSTRFFPSVWRMYAGLAAFVLIIGGTVGTAYASESALPGEPLYTLKTHVAEPVQTALIPSAKGKAAWHAILAERRLEEAAQLAAEDKLSPQVQEELAANLDVHVAASVKNAERLEESGDSIGSLDVRSDLEARLTAHEHILAVMASHLAMASSSEKVRNDHGLGSLLAVVERHKANATDSRLALEHALVPHEAKDTASTSAPIIAMATVRSKAHFAVPAPADRVATAEVARTEEIADILEQHAVLLAKFMPPASTTASTTATTTATTTPKVEDTDKDSE